jgi:Icc-related predicted phosphoesterase
MRILHCTDFHANLGWFHWLAQAAPHYDLVCLSGDLLDMGFPKTIPHQQAEIKAVLGAIATPLAICSGNHDMVHSEHHPEGALWVRDLKRQNVWVDGDRFRLGGHHFHCQSWNEPIPPARSGEIWIIHAPPEGCAVAVSKYAGDVGDFEFSQLCLNAGGPRLALCGHVHSPQRWHSLVGVTRIFNPGCNATDPWPAHVVFDLAAGTATRRLHGLQEERIFLIAANVGGTP